ncbi:MAG: hypothetical protein FWE29_00605 [Defluviitaleaceae bacterium]|nr:hypothetical protein [Defluviitaleaceae bacterium]
MVALLEKRKTHLEDVVGKRRFDEFWADNQPLKSELETEKKSLEEKKAVQGQIDSTNNAIEPIQARIDYAIKEVQERSYSNVRLKQ